MCVRERERDIERERETHSEGVWVEAVNIHMPNLSVHNDRVILAVASGCLFEVRLGTTQEALSQAREDRERLSTELHI